MSWVGDNADIHLTPVLLSKILPLHVLLDQDGTIRSIGPTAAKLLPKDATRLEDGFKLARRVKGGDFTHAFRHALQVGLPIELQHLGRVKMNIRAHVIQLSDEQVLLNMCFGMNLHIAFSQFGMTQSDFPSSSLAREFMILYEANRAAMREYAHLYNRLLGAHQVAETQAHTDSLTGLLNRRGLEIALAAAIHPDELSGGRHGEFALAQLDLDYFKQVNDNFGHAAGDEVLRNVARILASNSRSADRIARTGGDEFVLLVQGISQEATLRNLGERIIASIEEPFLANGQLCQISASIGFVISTNYTPPNARNMMRDADWALYQSKHNGRGRVTIVNSPMTSPEFRQQIHRPAHPTRPV